MFRITWVLFLVFTVSTTIAQLNNFNSLTEKDFTYFENNAKKNFSNEKEAQAEIKKHFSQLYDRYNLPSLMLEISMNSTTFNEIISNQFQMGQLDLENNVPVSYDAKYRIGSVSKTFTSAVVALLVEQGKLSYNTPINSVLASTDFPVKKWHNKPVNITVGQLLSHTAGLHATSYDDFKTVFLTPNATQMIHKFKDEPLLFEPGTSFKYSNYGFQVASAVVEVVTGRPYIELLGDLLHRSKLNETYAETCDLMIKHRARYYRAGKTETQNLPTLVFDEIVIAEGYLAAGGIDSNLHDLSQWGRLMIDSYKGRPGGMSHLDFGLLSLLQNLIALK